MPILTKISKRWKKSGQQANRTRLLLCNAFLAQYSCPEIALQIRRYSFRSEHFSETSRGKVRICIVSDLSFLHYISHFCIFEKDLRYKSIISRVQKTKKMWESGMMKDLLDLEGKDRLAALKKKSISINARGRKSIQLATRTEKVLLAWLEERWKLDQRVSRTMIFRKVLEIDPKFKGGVESDGYLARLKKWFYYGFKIRNGLSNRKICGAGQKLPANWEQALIDMHGKVRAKQQPEMRADGSVRIAGVKDAHFCNTDHVPVWYESVGNYSWGKKCGGRRHVRTGGKEKDRFTAQLSITKDGRKLTPFLIYKGEY